MRRLSNVIHGDWIIVNLKLTSDKTPHSPLILDIKGNSLDDGPGIRSVIFFKGCPLSCIWCHNPESKKTGVEISFDQNECIACDSCIAICPQRALSRNNPFFIDRKQCDLCFSCVSACPSGALDQVGKKMSVGEIMDTVKKDQPFFKTSGGGVTLSGGEPTLYMDFLSELIRSLKSLGIHVLIETCGLFRLDDFMEKILPYTDMIYFDIKLIDAQAHQRYCGVSNEIILENFRKLNQKALSGRFHMIPRTPLIPGITTTQENLTGIAAFLKSQGVRTSQLLAYNPLWFEKNKKIGITGPMGKNTVQQWIPSKKIEEYQSIFKEYGIAV